jgi:hypothetical protein
MAKQPNSLGFTGSFNEIIANYQKVFCREYNLDEKKHDRVNPAMKGVKVKYVKCTGLYPPYAFSKSCIGNSFSIYNSSSGSIQMVDITGGHHTPEDQYIFEITRCQEDK